MLILFDWDGTIAKGEIAEEAALLRLKMLGVRKTREWMRKAQQDHSHYDVTKRAIAELTGISGDRELTVMMTNLFQICYLATVNKHKHDVFYGELHLTMEKLKGEYGLTYAIVSTLREDIIRPSVELLGVTHLFDYIIGNSADLRYSKTDLVRELQPEKPALIVGDRKDDIIAGKEIGIKTAYAMWGYGRDKDAALADYKLLKPADLSGIIEHVLRRP